MKGRILEEVDEDAEVLDSTVETGIDIWLALAVGLKLSIPASTYRLGGSCLLRPWVLFIGS